MNSQVFLSYSRKDQNFALELAQRMKQRNVPVWVDQWDIPPSANWPREVQSAIQSCTHVLLVLSPNSIASKEVRSEMYYASDSGKIILPVICAPCDIPLRIRPLQYVDFTSLDYSTALEKVIKLFESQASLPLNEEPAFVIRNHDRHPDSHPISPRRLALNSNDRWIAGALSGLAEYWGVSALFLRLTFIVLALLTGGFTLLLYPIIWWWVARKS